MPTEFDESAALDDPSFQAVLVACLEALERGEMLDEEELRAENPRFADVLAGFLADREQLVEMASAIRDGRDAFSDPNAETLAPRPARPRFAPGTRIRYFGDYELVEEIARGGMGVVYKARQSGLNRTVALKMILSGHLANDLDVQRFEREARAAARLSHPNIVAVHEVGEHDGQHYFSMDYVEGRSLAERIREEPLPARDAAILVRTVAEAIHAAHEQGTLHRDLKPGNVLLDLDGVPHVTDFGLAKVLGGDEDESDLTTSGQILGTPSYMAPEQAEGKHDLVAAASDVYALGAILYACLTGRAPFVAESPMETLMQVIRDEPVPPRMLNSAIPRDLETICLKCLRKRPHERYGSAELLAEDLVRFLEGRPVVARPIGRLSRTWRWCRRNPAVASLSLLAVLLLVVGTTVSTVLAIRERDQRRIAELARGDAERDRGVALGALEREEQSRHDAEEARDEADEARIAEVKSRRAAEEAAEAELRARQVAEKREREALWNLYVAQLHRAVDSWREGELGQLDRMLDEMGPSDGEPDFRGWEWRFLRDRARRELVTLPDGPRYLSTAAWRPDGAELAVVADDRIRIWNVVESRFVRVLPHVVERSIVNTPMGWSPDGRLIAYARTKGDVLILDAHTGEIRLELQHPKSEAEFGWMTSVEFSPDGSELLTSNFGGRVAVWNVETGNLLRTPYTSKTKAALAGAVWHPDGDRFAMIRRGLVEVRSADDGKVLWARSWPNTLWSLDWSPSGRHLAVGQTDIRVYDGDGELVGVHATNGDRVARIDWIDDERFLSANFDHTIRSWHVDRETPDRTYRIHAAPAYFVATRPGGDRAVSVGLNEKVRLVALGEPAEADEPFATGVASARPLHWSPDGRRLLGTVPSPNVDFNTRPRTLRVWDRDDPSRQWTMDDSSCGSVQSSGWEADGRRVAVLAETGKLFSWDVETGAVFPRAAGPLPPDFGGTWRSPDSAFTLSTTGKSTVSIVHGDTEESALTFDVPFGFSSAAWSPTGDRLAIGSYKQLWILDRGTWRKRRSTAGNDAEGFRWLAWSPDGRTVAVATGSGGIHLYSSNDLKLVAVLRGHTRPAVGVVWSPGGDRLASSSEDGTVRIREAATGRELLSITLPGERTPGRLAWSSDGSHLTTVCKDGAVFVWSASPVEPTIEPPEPIAPPPLRAPESPALAPPPPPMRTQIVPEGLVAYLRFDETEGRPVRDSVTGNVVAEIPAEGAAWGPGVVDGALVLDGRSALDLGQLLAPDRTDPFTIALWVRGEPVGRFPKLLTKWRDHGFVVTLHDEGGMRFQLVDRVGWHAVPVRSEMTSDTWAHFAFVYDGSGRIEGARAHVDGTLVGRGPADRTIEGSIRTEAPLRVGLGFAGAVDDLRLYDRALTDEELSRLAGRKPGEQSTFRPGGDDDREESGRPETRSTP